MSVALLRKIPIAHPRSWKILRALFYNVLRDGVVYSQSSKHYKNFHTRILLNNDHRSGLLTCHPMSKDLSQVFIFDINDRPVIVKGTHGPQLSQDIFDHLVFFGNYDHYQNGKLTHTFWTISAQEIKDAAKELKVSKLI